MSRRPAYKIIHYVRATYNVEPNQTLDQLVRSAMRKLGSMGETEVAMSTLGTAGIRHRRDKKDEPLLLTIGAGVPGEQMTTMGLQVKEADDEDRATNPPANRAFKHSDAFVLVDDNDLLLITEGSFRVSTLGVYLRLLISKAGLKAGDVAFELRKVTNQDQATVLADEGIKELRLRTNMFRATHELNGAAAAAGTVSAKLKSFVGGLKELFAEDVTEAERELLAQHWGEVQVNTVIRAEGGSRAEDIVLEAMKSVGEEVLDEDDANVDVTVITQKGNEIHLGQVTSSQKVKLMRREGANDLINTEVYTALTECRDDLVKKKLWQK